MEIRTNQEGASDAFEEHVFFSDFRIPHSDFQPPTSDFSHIDSDIHSHDAVGFCYR